MQAGVRVTVLKLCPAIVDWRRPVLLKYLKNILVISIRFSELSAVSLRGWLEASMSHITSEGAHSLSVYRLAIDSEVIVGDCTVTVIT